MFILLSILGLASTGFAAEPNSGVYNCVPHAKTSASAFQYEYTLQKQGEFKLTISQDSATPSIDNNDLAIHRIAEKKFWLLINGSTITGQIDLTKDNEFELFLLIMQFSHPPDIVGEATCKKI